MEFVVKDHTTFEKNIVGKNRERETQLFRNNTRASSQKSNKASTQKQEGRMEMHAGVLLVDAAYLFLFFHPKDHAGLSCLNGYLSHVDRNE
jgi:hypothetical protein